MCLSGNIFNEFLACLKTFPSDCEYQNKNKQRVNWRYRSSPASMTTSAPAAGKEGEPLRERASSSRQLLLSLMVSSTERQENV